MNNNKSFGLIHHTIVVANNTVHFCILPLSYSRSAISLVAQGDNHKSIDKENRLDSSWMFCVVLDANNHHFTASSTIVYSWGKRCDRFYFITRLLNVSVGWMMIEQFEKAIDSTLMTITQHKLNVLWYLNNKFLFSSYRWLLPVIDHLFVILSCLRLLIVQLQSKTSNNHIA